MKIYVKCMGKSKKDIVEDLDNKSVELIRHLIKIVLYQDRGNLDHWSKELYGFLPSIPSLKGRNRYPSKDYIYEPYPISEDEIREYVYRYLEWVADELSTYGVLEGRNACAQKATELAEEYR